MDFSICPKFKPIGNFMHILIACKFQEVAMEKNSFPVAMATSQYTPSQKVWMDDLWFYVLFDSISIISRKWLDDNGRLSAMEPCLPLERLLPRAGLEPRVAGSIGQCLTYWATWLLWPKVYQCIRYTDWVQKQHSYDWHYTKSVSKTDQSNY